MATHYKGERIEELLGEIATLQAKLDNNAEQINPDDGELLFKYATAYSALVLAKAKLTALQGESK